MSSWITVTVVLHSLKPPRFGLRNPFSHALVAVYKVRERGNMFPQNRPTRCVSLRFSASSQVEACACGLPEVSWGAVRSADLIGFWTRQPSERDIERDKCRGLNLKLQDYISTILPLICPILLRICAKAFTAICAAETSKF